MRAFDLLQPTTVDEAVGLLSQHGDEARLLAGGAMLTILLRERLIAPRYLVSILEIPRLADLSCDGQRLTVGAAATLGTIEQSAVVRYHWPVLAEAAHLVGNVRVRNVATIGGHLAHADPHLDLPPVLIALGASIEIEGPRRTRNVPLEDLFVGYYETSLAPDEMVVRVLVPTPRPGVHGAYLKYCSLSPNDWPTVGVAAVLRAEAERVADLRLVVGSVSDRPLRLPEVEALLEGEPLQPSAVAEAGRRYAAAADPISDLRGSADYKREVTAVYVRRAVMTAAARAGLAPADWAA